MAKLCMGSIPIRGIGMGGVDIQTEAALKAIVEGGTNLTSSALTSVQDYAFYNNDKRAVPLEVVNLSNVITVGNYAFYESSASSAVLSEVHLPKVTEIGEYAFQNCAKVTTVEIPNASTIGTHAFYSCDSLTSIDIPLVTTVPTYMCYGCDSLTSADCSQASTVSTYAFRDCSNLIKANIPSATGIGSYAFYGCKSLKTIGGAETDSVVISDSLTGTIGTYAFNGCTGLLIADFRNATNISSSALYGCTSLDAMILRSATQATISSSFAKSTDPIPAKIGYIYVPAALLDGYVTTYPDYNFRTIEEYPELSLYKWKRYSPARTYTFEGWTGDTITTTSSTSVTVYSSYKLNPETGIVEVSGTSSTKSAASISSGYRKGTNGAQKYVSKTYSSPYYKITWQNPTVSSVADWDTLTYVDEVYSTLPDRYPDGDNDGTYYYVKEA